MSSAYVPYSDVYSSSNYGAQERSQNYGHQGYDSRDRYNDYDDQDYGRRNRNDDYEDDDYEYARNRSQRRSKTRSRSRSQYRSREDVDAVRRQQYESFNRPGLEKRDLNDQNLVSHRDQAHKDWMRERSADDAYYSRRRSGRQDTYSSYASSGSDDRSRDRRQKGNRPRRAQSEGRQTQITDQTTSSKQTHYDGDLRGMAKRNLDMSEDGAMFAALGAGIGAIAARRFGPNHFDQKSNNQTWMTVGGALVGGVAANAAEKQWTKRRLAKKTREGQYENQGQNKDQDD